MTEIIAHTDIVQEADRALELEEHLGSILVKLAETEQFDIKSSILDLVDRIVAVTERDPWPGHSVASHPSSCPRT
jgi:hypothetical protein